MSFLSQNQLAELQQHLRAAVLGCSSRGLYQSSKWAAELLTSLPQGTDDDRGPTTPPKTSPLVGDPHELELEAREHDQFLLARTFFDCREYDRCSAVFLPSTRPRIPVTPSQTTPSKLKHSAKGKEKSTARPEPLQPLSSSLADVSQKALFLSIYSKYLAGEKRRDEDSEMILGPADGGVTLNRELPDLISLLASWLGEQEAGGSNGGGWLEYLYGILLAKNKSEDAAKEWFLKSIHLYPFNWGAWQELSNLQNNSEELEALITHLPRNIMTFMFVVHTNQELGQCTEKVHQALDQIEDYFPNSSFLKSQRALLFYRSKDFEESNAIFTQLLLKDPYRLDTLDNYSNVLYVLNYRPQLAFLAHLAAQTDKFRPETCCIVGNYYSRNSEHEKAVMYFRRALTLDRCFTSAWTLMGHEYVEMKNTHAALESYRRAVDVNRKDYRAWYGLGLTYEMLEMHSYALFYHQRAAALRPFDAKTWQAVGACFARVGKLQNAVRAYKRALVAGSYYEGGGGEGAAAGGAPRQHHHHPQGPADGADGFAGLSGGVLDPESLYQIALLYERMGDNGECAAYMELVLAQEVGPGGAGGADGGDDLGGLVGDSQDSSTAPGASKGAVSGGGGGAQGAGVGVTVTTSKARLWLARWLFYNGDFGRAGELANELCQDGVEVEEAKALIRDIRSRADSQRIESSRAS